MTIEVKNFISPDEIIGFQFICPKCDASAVVRLNNTNPLPVQCPSCNLSWVSTNDEHLAALLKGIRDLRTALYEICAGAQKANPNFRLELKAASSGDEKR